VVVAVELLEELVLAAGAEPCVATPAALATLELPLDPPQPASTVSTRLSAPTTHQRPARYDTTVHPDEPTLGDVNGNENDLHLQEPS
jgi:hypothetical protein